MNDDGRWRPGKWKRSLRYAYEGIQYALSTQANMKFHFVAAFVVLLAALVARLSRTDILFLLLAVTLMIVTELINTAVEKTVDLAMPDRHPLAKIAKDVAAASVLVSAVFAVMVGMIVFYEPLDRLMRSARAAQAALSPGTVWISVALVLLSVIVMATRFQERGRQMRPSLFTAVAFAAATLIAFAARPTWVGLLAYFMAVLIAVILYDKTTRSLGAWRSALVRASVWRCSPAHCYISVSSKG
ncbi:diacylglycerol kinase family protein [Gordoniibacillus kamchatkensis]|uniref:diacylglycerol kinase family protein n=1 Tax=Gordoniibacillus kamchatkensis TaxID=1590651 RepID=UPI000A8D0CDF|nr:diacylglycerol kinase family protein [Paenibacillus sp. VKM B-2647]